METKEILRELIHDSLDNGFVSSCIREEVQEIIKRDFARELRQVTEDLCRKVSEKYINEEIQKVISGRCFCSDGWGKVEEYGSFDEFVKSQIEKNLRSTWKVPDLVRKAVKDTIELYANHGINKKIDMRVDEVLELIADDVNKRKGGNKNG